MPLRIGVLGAGGHSNSNHGPALARCVADGDDVELAAVCDLDGDRAAAYAERFGFAGVYTDLDQLLAADLLDGLIAVTPLEATESLAGRILQAKLPVVIEKPPGVGAAATARLVQIARQTATPHMVSFNRRFCPALTRARHWMAQQGLRPQMIIGRMLRCSRLEPFFARDTGIHLIDCVLSLAGRPDRVEARIGHGCRAAHYTGSLHGSEGPEATIHIAPDAGTAEESVELLCEDARVFIDFQQPAVHIDSAGERIMTWCARDDKLPLYEENGSLAETRAFLQGLRQIKTQGTDPADSLRPSLEQGLLSMQVADAFQQGCSLRLSPEST